jgi:hypothetical protein
MEVDRICLTACHDRLSRRNTQITPQLTREAATKPALAVAPSLNFLRRNCQHRLRDLSAFLDSLTSSVNSGDLLIERRLTKAGDEASHLSLRTNHRGAHGLVL